MRSRSQRGGTDGRACHMNLLSFSDRITGLVGKGSCVDIVHSDLSKAFDLLPPDILIKTCIIRN